MAISHFAPWIRSESVLSLRWRFGVLFLRSLPALGTASTCKNEFFQFSPVCARNLEFEMSLGGKYLPHLCDFKHWWPGHNSGILILPYNHWWLINDLFFQPAGPHGRLQYGSDLCYNVNAAMEVSAAVLTSLTSGQGTALKTNLEYRNHIHHHNGKHTPHRSARWWHISAIAAFLFVQRRPNTVSTQLQNCVLLRDKSVTT